VKSNDLRADNLLLRLFAYTPRPGRSPLEDYCSEALAWCLRNSPHFQVAFLRTVGLATKNGERVAIATQHSYEYDGDEGDTDENITDAGRFDLRIQIGDTDVLAVVEIKVGAGFGREQLSRYRKELERQQRKLGFKKGILVTLTDTGEKPEGSQAHVDWASVAGLLEKQERGQGISDYANEVCQQFAEFLKEKGLGPMKLPSTASAPLNDWVNGLRFRRALEDILMRVKSDSEIYSLFGRKGIEYEETADRVVWIGIYGNTEQFSWMGFGFRQKSERVEVFMLVQTGLDGDRRREFQKYKTEYKDGKTWVNLERILDADLDGNGEKIKQWLICSVKELSKVK
jgi:hypothetical protein